MKDIETHCRRSPPGPLNYQHRWPLIQEKGYIRPIRQYFVYVVGATSVDHSPYPHRLPFKSPDIHCSIPSEEPTKGAQKITETQGSYKPSAASSCLHVFLGRYISQALCSAGPSAPRLSKVLHRQGRMGEDHTRQDDSWFLDLSFKPA